MGSTKRKKKNLINKHGISIPMVLLVPGHVNILHLKGNGDLFRGKNLPSTPCITYGSADDFVNHFIKRSNDNVPSNVVENIAKPLALKSSRSISNCLEFQTSLECLYYYCWEDQRSSING